MTTPATMAKPRPNMTDTTIAIRNAPNNCGTRFPCTLCDGYTEKQPYLFELPDGDIVCDECAQNPPPGYITEVVPCPEESRYCQCGMYSEANWPDWMRTRINLTNGTAFLPGIDGRTKKARRYRELVAGFSLEIAPDGELSVIETILARRAASITMEAEELHPAILRGNANINRVVRNANSFLRTLRMIEEAAEARRRRGWEGPKRRRI